MRSATRLSTRLAYWLRLTVAAGAGLWHVFRLLRQGDRNIRTLMRYEKAMRGDRLRLVTKYARLITTPLRHCATVLQALPTIAGANPEEYQAQLAKTYERVQSLSTELANGRSFLPSPCSRKLQRLLIPVVFYDFLSIAIKPEQAIAFAFYAESSEVVRDFLDFCRHNEQFGNKDSLLAALPVFTQLVKDYFWIEPKNDKHGPQPGELCHKPVPEWTHVRFHDKWFHPGKTLICLYWSSIEAKEILDRTGLSPSACERLEQHFIACAASRSESLLGVLAFEMHHRACFDLVRTAAQFSPPSPGRPNAPSKVTALLDECLSDLDESLRETSGQGSKKPLSPKLVKVR
jgi:hypothetical protein